MLLLVSVRVRFSPWFVIKERVIMFNTSLGTNFRGRHVDLYLRSSIFTDPVKTTFRVLSSTSILVRYGKGVLRLKGELFWIWEVTPPSREVPNRRESKRSVRKFLYFEDSMGVEWWGVRGTYGSKKTQKVEAAKGTSRKNKKLLTRGCIERFQSRFRRWCTFEGTRGVNFTKRVYSIVQGRIL